MNIFLSFTISKSKVPRQFLALCDELTSRGHKVTVISWKTQDVPNVNVKTVDFPSRRPTKLKDLVFLLKLIKKERPDLLIANFGSVNLMLLAGFFMGVPVRVAWYRTLSEALRHDWRGSNLAFFLLKVRKRLVYKLATHFVANSKAALLDLSKTFAVPLKKIVVFHNAAFDIMEHTNKRELKGEKKIVFVGRLYPTKGVDVLIRALDIIVARNKSYSLIIIGDGPLKSKLESLSNRLGLSQKCTFIGAVPNDKVVDYFKSADVAVVPSRNEAFGIVAIEALMVGTPVVASRVGGLVEIVRNGIDGFLVEPDSPKALAKGVLSVFEDEAKYYQMCQNARQRFLDKFEVSRVVQKQADWIESLEL